MTRCAQGPVIFWLLTMIFTGMSFCTCTVCAEDRGKSYNSRIDGLAGEAWKDWLPIEDGQPLPLEETSLLVRRITPKSVFVAPNFSGCSDGYRQDGMGRCVKLVKVNQAAQLDFILQKLNSKYASSNNNNNNHKNNNNESGPFHVSLPLGISLYGNNSSNSSTINNNNYNNSINNITKTENHISSTEVNHLPNNDDRFIVNTKTTAQADLGHDTTTHTESTIWSTNAAISTNTNTKPSSLDILLNKINIKSTSTVPTVPYINEENYPEFEIPAKRQPEITPDIKNKPFVIVVANSTDNIDYLFENTTENIKTTVTESVPYTEISTNTYLRTTTDIYADPFNVTPTDKQNNSEAETTTPSEPFSTEDGNIFLDNTPSTFATLSTEHENEPTPINTDMETLTTPQFQRVVSPVMDGQSVYTDLSFTDISEQTTAMSLPNEDPTEGIKYLFPESDQLFDKEILDIRDPSKPNGGSQHPSSSQDVFEFSRTNCENPPDSQNDQTGYGKVMNTNSANKNCRPSVTTIGYPVQTTTAKPLSSYYIRFPLEDLNSKPSSLYSSYDDHKKNNMVRFPGHSSISSSHQSLPYGSKLWNTEDGLSSSSSSTGMWYSPPSWFPFLQSHSNWMSHHNQNSNYNDNEMNRRPLPVSTTYHKQYVNYRPSTSVHIPTWVNRHVSWPQRD